MWSSTVFADVEGDGVAFFAEYGWVLTRTLDDDATAAVRRWVDEIMGWTDDGEWLHYREMTEHGPRLCRSENFVPFHAGLRGLLTEGAMLDTASALLGEPAVLYKEKINYKAAGGAGYAAHQDAPAYRFVDSHVSCMVAVDDANAGTGAWRSSPACTTKLLPTDDAGMHPGRRRRLVRVGDRCGHGGHNIVVPLPDAPSQRSESF